MKQKYDIIEGNTLQEAFDKGYKKYGYLPLSLKKVWILRRDKMMPEQWYNGSTVFFEGEFRQGTIEEFKDLEKFYGFGGRVPFAGLNCYGGFAGSSPLPNYGRFVWKVKEVEK